MFEETNPSDFNIEEIESIIEPLFLETEPTVKFLYHGTYNVYLVNGEFIFRFPSRFLPTAEKVALVKQELSTLQELKGLLSWKVPEPIFSEVSSETQFIGYHKVPGESLSPHFNRTSNEEKKRLAKQIAEFLSELHPLRIKAVKWRKTQEQLTAYRREWTHFYRRVKNFCYKRMTESQAIWVDDLFNQFLTDESNFAFDPVLIHGDFDTSNILVDPKTFEITGIIDFEETRYYDPAYDFIFLSEGKEFQLKLLSDYKGELDSKICERILFLFGRQPLHYILSGLEYDIEKMVHYGLDELDERIRNWDLYTTYVNEIDQVLKK